MSIAHIREGVMMRDRAACMPEPSAEDAIGAITIVKLSSSRWPGRNLVHIGFDIDAIAARGQTLHPQSLRSPQHVLNRHVRVVLCVLSIPITA